LTTARPDTELVFDPATYTEGVPFDALARLRRAAPVAWVPEIPVLGWPEGPGFWLVLRHADVESVLTRPKLFSSALGATQIRDPATPQALGYVRRMMLNMDPPEHARLRRLLSRSFTPRAVATLEDRICGHARAICDRAFAGPRGLLRRRLPHEGALRDRSRNRTARHTGEGSAPRSRAPAWVRLLTWPTSR